MSAIVETCRDAPTVRSFPIGRWTVLAALLMAEILGVTVCFDTANLMRVDAWWAHRLGHSSHVLQLAVAAVVAVLLLRGVRPWRELADLDALVTSGERWKAYLLGHLGAFATFIVITARLMDGNPGALPHGQEWFMAWMLAGLLTLTLWGAAMLPPRSWVPLAKAGAGPLISGIIVGALAWVAGQLTTQLWDPLCRWTFFAVGGLLKLANLDVYSVPERFVIGTPNFKVRIAPECSGLEGIGLIWAFLTVYLWCFRSELRFPRALLLLPIGTVVIWFANAVRIAILVMIGAYGSRSVALGGFHSQAGWLAFNAVGLGLVVASRRLLFFKAKAKAKGKLPAEIQGPNLAAAYLAPLLAIIATMMITASFSAGRDQLYPLRVLAGTGALCFYWRHYADLRWTWSWPAAAIGVAIFALWLALEPSQSSPDPHATALADTRTIWGTVWLIFRVVGSVAVVPLAEELAFRGFLTRRLISANFNEVPSGQFSWLSFLISSALFGALHGRWLAGTFAGLLLALALYRRRELADAVLAHATANALIAGYVLATGSWSLWNGAT